MADFRGYADINGLPMYWVIGPDGWPQELHDAYDLASPDGPDHWPLLPQRLQPMWDGSRTSRPSNWAASGRRPW